MTDLSSFSAYFQLGAITLAGTVVDGQIWFASQQALEALRFPRCALGFLRPDQRCTLEYQDQTQQSSMPHPEMVSECAVYQMLLISETEEARPFQRWVFGSLWPALQADGIYVLGEERLAVKNADAPKVVKTPNTLPSDIVPWLATVVLPTVRMDQIYVAGEEILSMPDHDPSGFLDDVRRLFHAKIKRCVKLPSRMEHASITNDFIRISDLAKKLS